MENLTIEGPSQAGLFGDEPAVPGPWYVLTNRFNLLEGLALGYLPARTGFRKYYRDSAEATPGYVPLARGPVGPEVAAAQSIESEQAFPVLLEISRPPSADQSDPEGVVGAAAEAAGGVLAALPLSKIVRVLFRSEVDLEEHRARSYANLPDRNLKMVVEPAAFGGGLSLDTWAAQAAALPRALILEQTTYDRADRAGAMLVAVAATIPPEPAIFERIAGELGVTPAASGVIDELAGMAWAVSELLTEPSAATADRMMFIACAEVLSGVDRSLEWHPEDVVAQIEQRMHGIHAEKRLRALWETQVSNLRAALRNEADLRLDYADPGCRTLTALAMVLSAPDIEESISRVSKSGPGSAMSVLANALRAVMVGRSRMSTGVRPAGLDDTVATWTIAVLQRAAAADYSITVQRPVLRESPLPYGGRSLGLFVGESCVWTVDEEERSVSTQLARLDLDDPVAGSLAMKVCESLGWTDAIVTRVRTSASSARVGVADGVLQISMRGLPQIESKIDAALFRDHVASWSASAEAELSVRLLLSGVTPGDRNVKRRRSPKKKRAPEPAPDGASGAAES